MNSSKFRKGTLAYNWSMRNDPKFQKELKRKRAGWKLRHAVRTGIIKKPDICPKCKRKTRIEGHHEDYDKPLDVEWMCGKCHRKLHRKPQ